MAPQTRTAPPHVLLARALAGPVVVGFDGSPQSRDALALGRDLAGLTGERLVIAVVQAFDMPLTFDASLFVEATRRQEEHAHALVQQAAGVVGGREGENWSRRVVEASSPAHGLQSILDEEGAGVAVLGRTHRHGPGVAVPGTTAARLLAGSPCAVAIAPPSWASRKPGIARIGAGVDDSAESRAALACAASLAGAEGGSLRAVSVVRRPNPANPIFALPTQGYGKVVSELRREAERRLRETVAGLGVTSAELLAPVGDPGEELLAQTTTLDLLVVGSRRYGPLRSVLVGDVATRLALEARCALVVVPRGAASPPAA